MNSYKISEFDIKIKSFEGVMDPSGFSLALASGLDNHISFEKANTALDLGTGSGFLAIILAKMGIKAITAVDIDPKCLRASSYNAKANQCSEQITIIQSDAYNAVDGRFDLIVANPPTMPSGKFTPNGADSGSQIDLRRILDLVILGAPDRLTVDGRLVFIQSSLVDVHQTMFNISKLGGKSLVHSVTLFSFRDYYYNYRETFESFALHGSGTKFDIGEDGSFRELLFLIEVKFN